MNRVAFACADCLEEAGGRQIEHNITWHLDICPCCTERTMVTAPTHFCNPVLQPKILPLTDEKEKI